MKNTVLNALKSIYKVKIIQNNWDNYVLKCDYGEELVVKKIRTKKGDRVFVIGIQNKKSYKKTGLDSVIPLTENACKKYMLVLRAYDIFILTANNFEMLDEVSKNLLGRYRVVDF